MTREEAIDIIKCLAWHTRPNEEDIELAIKSLSTEPCEDCVSRAEALKNLALTNNKDDVYRMITRLSAVAPQPKMGHWIDYQKGRWIYAQCSECGTVHDMQTYYCPNCGAKMAGGDIKRND